MRAVKEGDPVERQKGLLRKIPPKKGIEAALHIRRCALPFQLQ